MENTVPEGYFGALEEVVPETEYQLVAGKVVLPRARHTFWDNEIQYHQGLVDGVSCTIHGPATNVSALTGYRFTTEELKKMWALVLNPPKDWPIKSATPGLGGYVSSGVYVNRKCFTIEELMTFCIQLNSQEALDAFEKGYMLTGSFGGNIEYNNDKEDGKLDLVRLNDKQNYWHCLSICQDKEDKTKLHAIVDNYYKEGSTRNIYKVPKANLPLLVASGVFSSNAYAFAYKQDVEHPHTLVSPWAVNDWDKAIKYRVIKGTEDPKSITGTPIDEFLLIKAGFLTSKFGSLTLERKLVALSRSGYYETLPPLS